MVIILCVLAFRSSQQTESGNMLKYVTPVVQWVKNLPAMQEMQETWVRLLGQNDPLKEEEMTTHSSIHSCLQNPIDRGVWWATVHGVAKKSRP